LSGEAAAPVPGDDAAGKPDLVLIHGLGSAATFWDNIRPDLDDRYRVTAVNLPGHGPGAARPSPADAHPRELAAAVAIELAAAGVTRPHVVGLSLGGWVALEMAALDHAASVVALAPAGLWRAGARIPREREEELLGRSLVLLDPVLPFFTRLPLVKRIGLRESVKNPERVTSRQFLAAARALRQARGYAVCDREAVRHHFEAGHRVTVPVAVAFGDSDRVLPPGTSQERRLAPEHADWLSVPDCGHAMTWDQPETCLLLIDETVRRATR
jgi:pimeloyl-ACP methyl ester carboxylesterase